MRRVYAGVSGITNITSVNVTQSHSASMATAVVQAETTTLNLGDYRAIDLGYSDDHDTIFRGYVTEKTRVFPEDTWEITFADTMKRAIDYFIVAPDPRNPYSWDNITGENLFTSIMGLCGLSNFSTQATEFTWGINTPVQIDRTSCYDAARRFGDILTWSMWADKDGVIHFKNRKPFYMTGSEPQPGWVNDPTPSITLTDSDIIEVSLKVSERDLRNYIKVWGYDDVYAEAYSAVPYDSYWKTVVVSTPWIDTNTTAQKAAEYNLYLLNRYTYEMSMTVVGNRQLVARDVVQVNSTDLGSNLPWYIFNAEHNLSSAGYTTSLELRR